MKQQYLLLFIIMMLLASLISCTSGYRQYRMKEYRYSSSTMSYTKEGIISVEDESIGFHIGDTIRMDGLYLKVIIDTLKP